MQALFSLCIISSAFLGVSSIAVAQESKTAAPRVFMIDGRKLAETKHRIKSGDQTFTAAPAHYQDEKFKAAELRIPKSDPTDREHLLSGQ